MLTIWKAAFDGDLNTVKKLLAANRALLDAPFQEPMPFLGTRIAKTAYISKKILAGMCVYFAYLGAAVATAETAGVAAVFVPSMLGAAASTWTAGDTDLEYHKKNKERWTPLDCAVFGFIHGNQKAADVVCYLIAEGARGANSAKNPNKKFFAVLGEQFKNPSIVNICNDAITLRESTRQLADIAIRENNLTNEKNELTRQLQAIAVQQAELQRRLTETENERIILNRDLENSRNQAAILNQRLIEINAKLGRLQPIGHDPSSGAQIFRMSPGQ